MNMVNIDKLSIKIHLQNIDMGWWDDPHRCIYQTLQLVSTEIAEATEGERKNLMDDHLPHRPMGEVELADTLIRLLDLAGRNGWLYTKLPHYPMIDDMVSISAKHLALNKVLMDLAEAIYIGEHDLAIGGRYSTMVSSIIHVAAVNGYDLEGAVYEKLLYNQERRDHKREERIKQGGKLF